MTLVFDATPLIYLGKADRIDVLAETEQRLVIPGRVYAEVVEDGTKRGYPDAKRIGRRCRDGLFERQTYERDERFERLSDGTNLAPADTATLLLADETDGTAVMDEKHGRAIAEVEHIDSRGTTYLLLSLVKGGDLPADEARETIDAMVSAGWHCSTDLYSKMLRTLEELRSE
jgi:predicted nucleic acid-binding protein